MPAIVRSCTELRRQLDRRIRLGDNQLHHPIGNGNATDTVSHA